MYLLMANAEDSLLALAKDIQAIDDFDYVDLGELSTLSLMEVTDGAASNWFAQEPTTFSEENGLMISSFSMEGVNWLRDFGDGVCDFGADPTAISDFANRCEEGSVYCLDTF